CAGKGIEAGEGAAVDGGSEYLPRDIPAATALVGDVRLLAARRVRERAAEGPAGRAEARCPARDRHGFGVPVDVQASQAGQHLERAPRAALLIGYPHVLAGVVGGPVVTGDGALSRPRAGDRRRLSTVSVRGIDAGQGAGWP